MFSVNIRVTVIVSVTFRERLVFGLELGLGFGFWIVLGFQLLSGSASCQG